MAVRGSRWESSVVTFGPIGRLLATAALGLVLVWFVLLTGLWAIPGVVIWGGVLMPWALRDIWRPASLPTTDLDRLRVDAAREAALRDRPAQPHLALDPDQPPPTRW